MLFGITLALVASVCHAAWNTVVKRVSAGGLSALWAYSLGAVILVVVATVAAAPAGVQLHITLRLLALSAGSTMLHTAYGGLTQEAYRRFELSDVYPVSRGVAPMIVALVGLLWVHQTLAPLRWTGLLLMAAALVMLVSASPSRSMLKGGGQPAIWGCVIAASIAAYTTYDGWAVVNEHVTPLSYYASGATLQLLLVTGLIRGRIDNGLAQLRHHRHPIAALAVLIPASYLLALYANQHAPISLVAAVRSSSLIWAALAAPVSLTEPIRPQRALATLLALAALVAMAT